MRGDGAHDRAHLADRHGKENKVGAGDGGRIVAGFVDDAELERTREIDRIAAQADDAFRRAGRLEPERERAADQTDTEDDYRIEAGSGHALSPSAPLPAPRGSARSPAPDR